jgi:tRNA A-37 threonylcarbamoyl transferase component Bud32
MTASDSTRDKNLTGAEAVLIDSLSAKTVESSTQPIILKYEPYAARQKWLEHRFSDWNSTKTFFAYLVVFLFFALAGPDQLGYLMSGLSHLSLFGPAASGAAGGAAATSIITTSALTSQYFVLEVLAGAFGLSAISAATFYAAVPSSVVIDYDGIQLRWDRALFKHSVTLRWHDMERIDLIYPPGKLSAQDGLIKFVGKPGIASLGLKLGAVSNTDLHEAIDRFAGNLSRDPHLIEVLRPAQDHSYTELWMQALSAPPKRERLAPLAPGTLLQEGRFKVDSQLGVGGQGTAYLAFSTDDDSEVVLKEFILPVYVDMKVRRQALERMQNEVAMLSRLDNERIVRLHDFFVEDHRGYLVLERIDGLSLRQIVTAEGCLTEDKVRDLAVQMCLILKYLQSLTPPVVHRDFTPDNLILGKDGVLKLVDFNVAQQSEETATATVVGKHSYLPPEQFRGKPTPQSDLYAMGATIYYLLVGEDPEPITSSHPILKNENISGKLDEIVAKATELDLKKRFQSALEVESALTEEYF